MIESKRIEPTDQCRAIVFAGKGGVGKTTCAAATSLHYADAGQRTLCISTDPVPSLSHIFDLQGNEKPLQVGPLLFINELGIAEVTEMWDRKFGREMYEVFSSFVDIDYSQFTEFMVSILPGLRDEFMVDYIRGLTLSASYDVIVWDTAPLGQTLALLHTPAMLTEHLRLAPRIYSRFKLGPSNRAPVMDIIKRWAKLSAADMDFLLRGADFNLVTIPEALAVEQLEPVSLELSKYGIKIQNIIVNNVIEEEGSNFLAVKAQRQKKHLETIQAKFPVIPLIRMPLVSYEIKGLDNLRKMAGLLFWGR